VLIALARHFAKPANQPERTLLFVASGGHHGGGMNGPGNLVTMNPQLKGKVVLVLNLEHIAQLRFQNDPFRVDATEQPMGFGISNEAPAIADVAKRGMQRYGFNLRPNFSSSIAGDLGGYAPLDVPRVQAIHSGPMYHTSGDTLDTISTPGLERAARFYAFFISEIAKTDRTALNPSETPAALLHRWTGIILALFVVMIGFERRESWFFMMRSRTKFASRRSHSHPRRH
jgi:hypothetical protein